MPEPTADQAIEANYRKILDAVPLGPEAVQQVVREISPGNSDWIAAAWDLIEARQATRPRFLFKTDDGYTVHWSPQEGVLRQLLAARFLKQLPEEDAPAPPDCQ